MGFDWSVDFGGKEFAHGRVEDNEDDEEMVEVRVDEEKEYTEHTAVAEYMDGTEEEFVFDSMKRKDGAIVLKNYTGYNDKQVVSYLFNGSNTGGFVGKAFATIPDANLKKFETTNRETKTMEYETTKKVPESELED